MHRANKPSGLYDTKADIKLKWENVIRYLRRDLPYIWTEELRKEFERIPNRGEKIRFILGKLLEFYQINPKKYSKEIFALTNLMTLLQYSNVDDLWNLIESDLFKRIFNQEEIEFFKGRLQNIAELLGKEPSLDFHSMPERLATTDTLQLLILEANDLNGIEQQMSFAIEEGAETLTLEPVQIGQRKVWVLSREKIYPALEAQREKVKKVIAKLKDAKSKLASKQYKKRKAIREKAKKALIPFIRRIDIYKKSLQELLAKINLSRKSKNVVVSLIILPILAGGFPSKVGSAFMRTKPLEETLKSLGLKDPKVIQNMLQASDFVDKLLEVIENYESGEINYEDLPDYIKELIKDGILDIAYFIGAQFEAVIPVKKDEIREIYLAQNKILLRIRYVDTREAAIKAFEEADVIHVGAHSRYGLGWALAKEGMGNPMKVQPSPIKIPKKELYGYKGKILKDLGKEVIVQASDEDIKKIKPRKGYQLISMATCSTAQYFLEVIKRLREGLPTTIIYSTGLVGAEQVDILLEGLLTGKKIEQIVNGMNHAEAKFYGTKRRYYHAVVLNTKEGLPESTAYDKFNPMSGSFTLFYDIITD